MKTIVLFIAALFFVSIGFSQDDEMEAYKSFQFKINEFRELVETNETLLVDAVDKETVELLADEIRQRSKNN